MSEQAHLFAAVGDLAGMFRVVGDRKVRRQDQMESGKAAEEYAELGRQMADLEGGSKRITRELRQSGYRMATLLGVVVLVLSLWFSFDSGL